MVLGETVTNTDEEKAIPVPQTCRTMEKTSPLTRIGDLVVEMYKLI